MIRRCDDRDFDLIWAIINDGARAYKGVIPEDRWTEPYMSRNQLQHEIDDGVAFWGYQDSGTLEGVMGVQQVQDVTLIRHAYVRTSRQKRGIGAQLLTHLRKLAKGPVLIGTWADAVWAIRFYEKNGFQILSPEQKDRLLRQYWTVTKRQIETSAVLADPMWREAVAMREMAFDERSVRPATMNDARHIAEVHVASWKTTYHSIFPTSVLEALSVEKRETFWKEMLLEARSEFITLVGCDPAGRVMGFASGGAERTGRLPCDGELHAIYLLEAIRGRGLGTLLVRRLACELQSRGFSSMAVWVLALNPYRKFYEALRADVIGEQEIERGGKSFVEIAYGWRDLSRLCCEIRLP